MCVCVYANMRMCLCRRLCVCVCVTSVVFLLLPFCVPQKSNSFREAEILQSLDQNLDRTSCQLDAQNWVRLLLVM